MNYHKPFNPVPMIWLRPILLAVALLAGLHIGPAHAARKAQVVRTLSLSVPEHAPAGNSIRITVEGSHIDAVRLRIVRAVSSRRARREVYNVGVQRGKDDYYFTFRVPPLTPGYYEVQARHGRLRETAYLRVTDLGLVTKRSPREVLVYAVSLSKGYPLSGVALRLSGAQRQTAVTNKQGVARFTGTPTEGELRVTGTRGGSQSMAEATLPYSDEEHRYKVLFFTERPIYRPGQQVYFKGIVRRDMAADGTRDGGNLYGVAASRKVQIEITDAANNKLDTLELKTNSMGSFAGATRLREEAPLGRYSVEIRVSGDNATDDGDVSYARFAVQAYRKPEYEVTATPQLPDGKPWAVQGAPFDVLVRARYLFGGAVKNARLVYSGDAKGETKLDENGEALVRVENPRPEKPEGADSDFNYYQEPSVTRNVHFQVIDASNRIVETDVSVTSALSDVQPGISYDSYVYRVNEAAKLDVETTDPLGRPVAASAQVRLITQKKRRTVNTDTGLREEKHEWVVLAETTVKTGSNGHGLATLKLDESGYVRVEVIATDSGGRQSRFVTWIWVLAQDESDYYGYEWPSLKVQLAKAAYAPGETVRALITTATPGKTALVTLEGDRIFMHRVIHLNARAQTVEFPFPLAAAPGAHLSVGFPHQTEWLSHTAYVKAPDPAKVLDLKVQPDKPEYRPGGIAKYVISAHDNKGRPVRSEVSLSFVDKAIYGIARDETPHPTAFFYGEQPLRVETSWFLPHEYQGGAYQRIERPVPVRQKFADTAYWNPFVTTNENGTATIKVQWPDNLTTWRATARAVTHDTKVGHTTQESLVTKPLLVRLTLPRFYVQHDRAQALVIVNNNTKKPQNVRVSLRSDGTQITPVGEEVKGAQRGTIEAGRSATFTWTVSVPEMPPGGKAAFTATVRGDEPEGNGKDDAGSLDSADAMKLTLPVLAHAVQQRTGNAGTLDKNNPRAEFTLAQPRPLSANVAPSRLEISISPSLAGPIVQALPHLIGFPYGCVEQTMSRFLPTVVAARVFNKVGYPLPDSMRQAPKMVQSGIDKLTGYQHDDGGWGWWEDDATDPFMTGYVLYGLGLTQEAGHKVDRGMIVQGLQSVRAQFRRNSQDRAATDAFGRPIPRVIDYDTRAWMMLGYATAMSAAKITSDELGYKEDLLGEVFAKRDQITTYSLSALAVAAARSGRGREVQAILETLEKRARSKAKPPETQWQGLDGKWKPSLIETWCDSNIEATALATQALILAKPDSPLITPALRWLLNQREGDLWQSTKDSSQVIITFADHLAHVRATSANETVRVLVNGELKQTIQFGTADLKASDQSVKLDGLTDDAKVVLEHDGSGTVNYTALLTAYSSAHLGETQDNGFSISRSYATLDNRGNWQNIDGPVANGQQVRVELRVTTKRDREYVLIEDPLPSGFEAREVEDEAVNADLPANWATLPLTRRETRDDRIALFCSYMGGSEDTPGQYVIRYVLRPEQTGTRTALPARVEMMYRPDINGRSAENPIEVK